MPKRTLHLDAPQPRGVTQPPHSRRAGQPPAAARNAVAALRRVADQAAVSLHQSLDSTATLAIGQPGAISPFQQHNKPFGSPLVDLMPPGIGDVVVVVPNPAASTARDACPRPSRSRSNSNTVFHPAHGAATSLAGSAEAALYAGALLKIRVPVAAVLAERRLPMGQVLRIAPGTVLKFDASCVRPLELEAGGRRIAVGEAVTIGERFGLRITELLR